MDDGLESFDKDPWEDGKIDVCDCDRDPPVF